MMVVANSTPLIYLATLSDFALLREIFHTIAIPAAVYREVVIEGRGRPGEKEVRKAKEDSWIYVEKVKDRKAVESLIKKQRFQIGESEAIMLYKQLRANLLLMDEQQAVRYARACGMNVIRTVGLYDQAKSRGLIGTIREKLGQLREEGFWLKDKDYEAILKDVGEE